MIGCSPRGVLGVSVWNGGSESGKCYISVASDAVDATLESDDIPAATWAVFPGEGNGHAIQELEARIVKEWLPFSGYEYALGPDIEVYLDENSEHMRFEVWIPVTKKSVN